METASPRFVFLDVDSILDGLRRATRLLPLVPGAATTRDLRLQMKPFTARVCGDVSAAVRCRHAVYQKTTPVLVHALASCGWAMEDQTKNHLSMMQKAASFLLQAAPNATRSTQEDSDDSGDSDGSESSGSSGNSDDDEDTQKSNEQEGLANGTVTTKTLVLVTGDTSEDVAKGRLSEILESFLHQSGCWRVEIHTWTHTLTDVFLLLAQKHSSRVTIQFLDGCADTGVAALDGGPHPVTSILFCAAPTTPNTAAQSKIASKPSPVITTTATKPSGDSPVKKPSPTIKSRKPSHPGIVLPPLIRSRLQRIHSLRERTTTAMYAADGRRRYVVMDADNIFLSLRNASHLHPLVQHASSPTDLRIHFKSLTNRVCNSAMGFKDDLVRELKAMHFATPMWLLRGLVGCRWTVEKQKNVSDASLHEELRRMLQEVQEEDEEEEEDSDDDTQPKHRTLVLVTGDGNDDEVTKANANASFRDIVDEYLAAGWSVEIHAWTHALHTSYIDLMEARPQDVLVRPLDDDYGAADWETAESANDGDDGSSTSMGSMVSCKLVYATPQPGNGHAAPATPTTVKPPHAQPAPHYSPKVVTTTTSTISIEGPPPLLDASSASSPSAAPADARVRQLEAQLASATRDKQALAMQMEMMRSAHERQIQQLTRARWDAFGACLRAITCPVTGAVLEDPVMLACCRMVLSKRAALQLRESDGAGPGSSGSGSGCPSCHVANFKMLSVPALDEVIHAVMDNVPT